MLRQKEEKSKLEGPATAGGLDLTYRGAACGWSLTDPGVLPQTNEISALFVVFFNHW
jgi:hypothetical protein